MFRDSARITAWAGPRCWDHVRPCAEGAKGRAPRSQKWRGDWSYGLMASAVLLHGVISPTLPPPPPPPQLAISEDLILQTLPSQATAAAHRMALSASLREYDIPKADIFHTAGG